MADDAEVKYEHQSVKVIRGREANKIAEMQSQRWELVSQTQGKLRTEMAFRRAKKTDYRPWIGAGVLLAVGILLMGSGALLGDDEPQPKEPPPAAASTESDDPTDDPSVTPSEPSESATPTEEQSAEPSSESPTEEPTEEASEEPDTDAVLTTANNQDLKRLLTSSENYALSKAFASKYQGRSVEFDGNVGDAASHDGASTRFDFLILTGDYSTTVVTPGPTFQFRDVNFYDLNVQGRGSRVGRGTNLHIVAKVGQFEQRTGLFLLDPVSTRLRR